MSGSADQLKQEKRTFYWNGHVTGTNRGRVYIRGRRRGETFRARATFDDQVAGATLLWLTGTVKGTTVELRIVDSRGLAPLLPLDGRVRLDFDPPFQEGEGTWQSDIGTAGTCRVHTGGRVAWWWRRLTVPVRHLWARHNPVAYMLLLLLVAGLSLTQRITISWPVVLLLLVPAPYVFQLQIIRLIQAFKVRRIGPVELEQNPVTAQVGRVIAEHVQEAVRFLLLDGFFVPRTKLVLLWLAGSGAVDRAQFNAFAAQVGVASDNIDVTLQAIVSVGCAVSEADRIVITDLGRRYVAHLTAPAPPQ